MIIEEFKKQSQPIIDGFKREVAGVRTNRPNTALVEDIKVSYYDQKLPLKQLGSISITPPRQINVQVWDKAAVESVSKAIESSSLGLSASAEGNVIRIFLPELSQERREELIKYTKRLAEQYRIKLRHLRDETNKYIQQGFDKKEITEDDKFKLKDEVQKEVDKVNEEIEEILENKVKEISS